MKKWHKWGGLILSFFLVMFALSGIFLNHRDLITGIDVPRSILPPVYRYTNWNNGAIKGTVKLAPDSILMFGGAGIFLSDPAGKKISRFENGMKRGADNRFVGNMAKTPGGNLFACTTFDLYRLDENTNRWELLSGKLDTHERISDLQAVGDSLIVLTRSQLFISKYPYLQFNKLELPPPVGYEQKASLFKTMWMLHSGELFGIAGKIIVDMLGVATIILCGTGLIYTFSPGIIKRRKIKKQQTKKQYNTMRKSISYHNKLGVYLLAFLIILVVSGMFLRPPLLIAIIRGKVKTIPGTTLHSTNAWFDKLRCIRYDPHQNEWILYSSDGFFSFANFEKRPKPMIKTPPVSVMGVTVLEQQDSTRWLAGSFSGLYYWDKKTGESIDAFTLKPATARRGGPPVITDAISGFSNDVGDATIAFDYSKGTRSLNGKNDIAPMPDFVGKESRMSLWHLCLEIHVGRIYSPIIGFFTDFFIFLSGVFTLVVLITGYVVYRRRYRKKRGGRT